MRLPSGQVVVGCPAAGLLFPAVLRQLDRLSGSATIAPAHSTIELIDHIRGAKSGPVPVSVMLDGEFGIENVVLGVPAHLGQGGLVKVEEINLTEDETHALHAAAGAIRNRLGL